MAKSLSNGHSWFCLAGTSSFGFNEVYWRFIDSRYHGEFISVKDGLALLSTEE